MLHAKNFGYQLKRNLIFTLSTLDLSLRLTMCLLISPSRGYVLFGAQLVEIPPFVKVYSIFKVHTEHTLVGKTIPPRSLHLA